MPKPNVTRLKELILYIVGTTGPVSRLKLAKLVYLVDWAFYWEHGVPLTKAYYLRERRGPVPATFASDLDDMTGYELRISRGLIKTADNYRFQPQLSPTERTFVDSALHRYRRHSERDLLIATYLSPPMKAILKEERTGTIRTHDNIQFHRFPRRSHNRGKHEALADSVSEVLSPSQLTDADTADILQLLTETLPLHLTAREIVDKDVEDSQ